MGNSLHLSCLPLKKEVESFDLKTCSHCRCLLEDRISSLPGDVLLLVLSFLPYKEVVKTSLLSHRWLNLWTHSLAINVHARVPKLRRMNGIECQDYVESVNHVIQTHKALYLEEFKIMCDLDTHNQEDIDSWLAFALAKKVQRLELNLSYSKFITGTNYAFLDHFLKSKFGGVVSRFLSFDLKCLKSLSLQSVDISAEAIVYFLLNIPFLERLEIIHSDCVGGDLVISGPNLALKYLKIKSCLFFESLTISNISLISLDIQYAEPPKLTLTNLPMFVELSISHINFSEVSSYYSQLEALSLSSSLKEITKLFGFNQLTKLKRLVIDFVDWAHPNALIPIIDSCPCLQEFVLKCWWLKGLRLVTGTMRDIHEPSILSSLNLKSKSLKVFEFKGYFGRDSDVEMIKEVVDYAVCLEKIIIDPSDVTLLYVPCGATKHLMRRQEKAKINAEKQFKTLRESIVPAHVDLLLIH